MHPENSETQNIQSPWRVPGNMPQFRAGTVWLVGAGPGAAELLSLLALHGIMHADVVVYDALVGKEVLSYARESAELIYAGKRGGKPSMRQPDISELIIRLAREGKRVLRLKGGDPFVFGRGAEEALALTHAGIKFRLVPGITSGIAGLAYAGVPLTHRDSNSAVLFLTGHGTNGTIPDDIDWASVARVAPVIVLYMAVKHAELITAQLINNGRPDDEPCAIISHATTENQKIIKTILRNLPNCAKNAETPAIIVIGQVVSYQELLYNNMDRF